jgi:hypothetical protein
MVMGVDQPVRGRQALGLDGRADAPRGGRAVAGVDQNAAGIIGDDRDPT